MLLRPNCNQILKSKNAVIFVFFVETTQKSHGKRRGENLDYHHSSRILSSENLLLGAV